MIRVCVMLSPAPRCYLCSPSRSHRHRVGHLPKLARSTVDVGHEKRVPMRRHREVGYGGSSVRSLFLQSLSKALSCLPGLLSRSGLPSSSFSLLGQRAAWDLGSRLARRDHAKPRRAIAPIGPCLSREVGCLFRLTANRPRGLAHAARSSLAECEHEGSRPCMHDAQPLWLPGLEPWQETPSDGSPARVPDRRRCRLSARGFVILHRQRRTPDPLFWTRSPSPATPCVLYRHVLWTQGKRSVLLCSGTSCTRTTSAGGLGR